MNLDTANDNISTLCDLIDALKTLNLIWPGYINDPVDVDIEGCFVP